MELVKSHMYSALFKNDSGHPVRATIRRVKTEYDMQLAVCHESYHLNQSYVVSLRNEPDVYLPIVNDVVLKDVYCNEPKPVVTITYDLQSTKPEQMPLPLSAASTQVVVDNYVKINKDIAKQIAIELTNCKQVKLIADLVQGQNFVKGLKGARYHSKFREVVMLAQHDVTSQVKHYLSKGTKVWLIDLGMNEVFELPTITLRIPTLREQMSKTKMFKINEHNNKLIDDAIKIRLVEYTEYHRQRKAEFKLESVLTYHDQSTLDIPRDTLEDIALTWSKALGYQFSRNIADRTSTILDNQYDKFEILPYAGASGYYFKGYFVEKNEPDARTEVRISPITRLKTRLGVPTQELEEFYQFYQALQEACLTEEALEPNWMLCPTCSKPVLVPEDYIPYADLDNKPECRHCGEPIADSLLLEIYYASNPDEN